MGVKSVKVARPFVKPAVCSHRVRTGGQGRICGLAPYRASHQVGRTDGGYGTDGGDPALNVAVDAKRLETVAALAPKIVSFGADVVRRDPVSRMISRITGYSVMTIQTVLLIVTVHAIFLVSLGGDGVVS